MVCRANGDKVFLFDEGWCVKKIVILSMSAGPSKNNCILLRHGWGTYKPFNKGPSVTCSSWGQPCCRPSCAGNATTSDSFKAQINLTWLIPCSEAPVPTACMNKLLDSSVRPTCGAPTSTKQYMVTLCWTRSSCTCCWIFKQCFSDCAPLKAVSLRPMFMKATVKGSAMATITEVADRSDAVLCSTCYVGFAVGVHTAFLSLNGYGCDGDSRENWKRKTATK